MTPLQVRIAMGLEDDQLLYHIGKLEGFGFLSPGEMLTLKMCWDRLDLITQPTT